MANEKNLKRGNPSTQIRSGREAVEKGKKGGEKSGQVRREKKLLKDCMLDLLKLPVADSKNFNKLIMMGLDPEEIDNRSLLTVALFKKAVESGDVNAFKEIRNLIGEDKTDNEDVMNKLDDVLGMIKGGK